MEVYGADIHGIDGQLVRITAVRKESQHGIVPIGNASKIVKEGCIRAAKAIETLGENWSDLVHSQGCTLQLSPDDTLKISPGLDLPIAVMLLHAGILQDLTLLKDRITDLEKRLEGQVNDGKKREQLLEALRKLTDERELAISYRESLARNSTKYLLIGCLDMASGQLTSPRQSMFGMMAAVPDGFTMIVPEDAETHAGIVQDSKKGTKVIKASGLAEVWDLILGRISPRRVASARKNKPSPKRFVDYVHDLKDIEGVERAKRALMVALAGGHNILLVGPPGQGKSMLAKAATDLLPPLNPIEMFELNKIYSAKGELHSNEIILRRPYREVQSSVTPPALFGGGHPWPLPGLVSLAHNGILFFDEINLFHSNLVEQLRNTLNDRVQHIQRVRGELKFPCRFVFAAAMNPCKCGWFGHHICRVCNRTFFEQGLYCKEHPSEPLREKCRCTRSEVEQYRGKLSLPLLDRIDLKVLVSEHDKAEVAPFQYSSQFVKRKISTANDLQAKRYKSSSFGHRNADIPSKAEFFRLNKPLRDEVSRFLEEHYRRLDLNKRLEVKLLLVSRTIADLEESDNVRIGDIREATRLMGLEQPYFKGFLR